MNDLNHPRQHSHGENLLLRGWPATSDTVSSSTRIASWSSDWNVNFPWFGAAMTLVAGAKSAIGRKVSFWDSQISSNRGRLSRTALSSRTSSLPVIPYASTVRFILLCSLWYATSAMSSNTGKSIMNQFRYPITLTFIQFAFVASYCGLFMTPVIRFSRMRRPTRAILGTTLPMGAFQVGGHIFSSMAISRIPVSTVHTIKALSPLFTVAAYALLFRVSYSAKTYISLLPLTLGVMLVCTFDVSGSNFTGVLCAFGSALVFVTSNIFFKKVMPSGASQTSSHKLDKLNLLFYSSGTAFLLMIPIWLYCDLPLLMTAYHEPEHVTHPGKGHDAPHSVIYYFFLNGSVHFAQNIIAFIILSSTSPVTYSIASLIKRVAVICIAIVWFSQAVHPVQALGIAMTFVGLYMYNQAKGDVERGENKMRRMEAARDLRLPVTTGSTDNLGAAIAPVTAQSVSVTSAYDRSWANPLPAPQRNHITNDTAVQQTLERDHRNTVSYSQHHSHPNLHIKIHPPSLPASPDDSNLNSYPSPPASLDSPPSSSVPLVDPGRHAMNSWISKRGGPLSAMGTANPNMESARVGVVA